MAKRKEKQPVPDMFTHYVVRNPTTDRVSSFHSNAGKLEFIHKHFLDVRCIKNIISVFIYNNIRMIYDREFVNTSGSRVHAYFPDHLQGVCTAWEISRIFNDTIGFYRNHIQQTCVNRTFRVHKNTDEGQKIKYSGLQTLLNAMRFRFHVDHNNLYVNEKVRKIWEEYCIRFTKDGVDGRERLTRLVKMHAENNARSLKCIHYSTGSYTKSAMFNKNSRNPTRHSYWFMDNSNALYKDWYMFKTPERTVRLPLSVDFSYHNKDYDLTREHTVSLNKRGEINIGLVIDKEFTFAPRTKTLALDTNVSRNLFAGDDGFTIALERDWLDKHVKAISKLQKKSSIALTDPDKVRWRSLTLGAESYLKSIITRVIAYAVESGVTDIVMENLTLTLGDAGSRYMNKLLRLLRFGTLLQWMREQAHTVGIRVHDLPSSFSSTACTHCHTVNKKNRLVQSIFHCIQCGIHADADQHAAQTLTWLFENRAKVLLKDGLIKVNSFGEYSCTSKARTEYRTVSAYYT